MKILVNGINTLGINGQVAIPDYRTCTCDCVCDCNCIGNATIPCVCVYYGV